MTIARIIIISKDSLLANEGMRQKDVTEDPPIWVRHIAPHEGMLNRISWGEHDSQTGIKGSLFLMKKGTKLFFLWFTLLLSDLILTWSSELHPGNSSHTSTNNHLSLLHCDIKRRNLHEIHHQSQFNHLLLITTTSNMWVLWSHHSLSTLLTKRGYHPWPYHILPS